MPAIHTGKSHHRFVGPLVLAAHEATLEARKLFPGSLRRRKRIKPWLPQVERLEDRWVPSSTSPASTTFSGAIIDNGTNQQPGTIQLGVLPDGNLGVDGGTPSLSTHRTVVGIRYMPTNADAVAPGSIAEGWGASAVVVSSGVAFSGSANRDFGGLINLTPVSFTATAHSAVSTVDIGLPGSASDTSNGGVIVADATSTDTSGIPMLQVTHDFHPSAISSDLFEISVTITNISDETLQDVRYRRVIDWDVEPTQFSEFITNHIGNANDLLFDSNDGFALADPLAGPSNLGSVGDFTNVGPKDQGALFDFVDQSSGTVLAPGASWTFTMYYGAAPNTQQAVADTQALSAEVYSLASPNPARLKTPADPGGPNTFIMAFKNVGGDAGIDTSTQAVVLPGSTSTVSATASSGGKAGISVTWNHDDSAADPVKVTTSTLTGIPFTVTNPGDSGSPSYTTDLRVVVDPSSMTGGNADLSNDSGTLVISYDLAHKLTLQQKQQLKLLVLLNGNYVEAVGEDGKPAVNDTDNNRFTLAIGPHSTPSNLDLKGTVFTITIPKPVDVPVVITPPVVVAEPPPGPPVVTDTGLNLNLISLSRAATFQSNSQVTFTLTVGQDSQVTSSRTALSTGGDSGAPPGSLTALSGQGSASREKDDPLMDWLLNLDDDFWSWWMLMGRAEPGQVNPKADQLIDVNNPNSSDLLSRASEISPAGKDSTSRFEPGLMEMEGTPTISLIGGDVSAEWISGRS